MDTDLQESSSAVTIPAEEIDFERLFVLPLADLSEEQAKALLSKVRETRIDAASIAKAEGRKHAPRKAIAAKVQWEELKKELSEALGREITDEELMAVMKKRGIV